MSDPVNKDREWYAEFLGKILHVLDTTAGTNDVPEIIIKAVREWIATHEPHLRIQQHRST